MDRAGIEAFCLSLPGAVLDYPFGPDTAVFKIGGKMFCALGIGRGVSFKVSDMAYEILTQNGMAEPAPYLARAKWVNLPDPAQWSDEELESHLRASYDLILGKLTRKARAELSF
jgi:predicted DNA-binding protein (MmcQ/YjbR family)